MALESLGCIKQVEILGGIKDFISIGYEGDDKLLLPVENMDKISEYSSYETIVKVDKLGKSTFTQVEEKIRQKLFEISNEIITLQVKREANAGKSYICIV